MTRIVMVLLIGGGLLADTASAQTWELLENAPNLANGRHEDVFFVTPEVGWIVGGRGIYKTINGGRSWFEQAPSLAFFRSAAFVDENIGWVGTLTEGRVLYETRDGGRTWTDITRRIEGPRPLGVCGLWLVDENTVYGVGFFAGPAHLIKTTDGGLTWTSTDLSAHAGTLVDVFFFDENRGFAVGGDQENFLEGRAVVLATTDGGATWEHRYTSTESGEWGWKISFPTPEVGYVALESDHRGKVLKTTDGGHTWTEHAVPRSRKLQGIGFISETVGWVGGRIRTSVTTDGGLTWAEVPFGNRLNRFRLFGDTLGFAIGSEAYIYRATPTARPAETPPAAFRLDPPYPNPATAPVTLSYTLHTSRAATLALYDVRGRQLRRFVVRGPGRHTLTWDGADVSGQPLAPGVYFYRLTAAGQSQTRALLLQR